MNWGLLISKPVGSSMIEPTFPLFKTNKKRLFEVSGALVVKRNLFPDEYQPYKGTTIFANLQLIGKPK